MTQLYGDVVPPYKYSPVFKRDGIISLNGILGASWQLTQLFSIDGHFQKGNIVSERPSSNIHSDIDLFYYNIGTTFSFSNWFWPNVKNRKWNSYLVLNTGFTHYRSAQFNSLNNEVIDFYGYELKEGKLEKTKRVFVPTAGIGIGVKYKLAKRLDIGLEIMLSSVYNDELDAYVRVFSEYDKFGHTNIGISYRFENHKKSLLWDYTTQPYVINSLLLDQLCECPIVKENTIIIDSLIQSIEVNNYHTDSVFSIITNRMDSVYFIIERERIVNMYDVDRGFGKDSLFVPQYILPFDYDSLLNLVGKMNAIIDTLISEREQMVFDINQGVRVRDNKNEPYSHDIGLNRDHNKADYAAVKPNFVIYQGVVQDENNKPVKASIFVIDKESQDLVASFETNSITGKYTFSLPVGRDYSFLVSSEGYGFFSENITLSSDNEPQSREISMIKLDVGKKFVLRNIYYDFDKYSIRRESNIELSNLYNIMISNPKLVIEISGHTDIVGSNEYNKRLSYNRAKAVVDYLVSRGISKKRLKYAGYGFDQPLTPNDTDEGRQLNRRTEFKILSN